MIRCTEYPDCSTLAASQKGMLPLLNMLLARSLCAGLFGPPRSSASVLRRCLLSDTTRDKGYTSSNEDCTCNDNAKYRISYQFPSSAATNTAHYECPKQQRGLHLPSLTPPQIIIFMIRTVATYRTFHKDLYVYKHK